ncbi:MAG: double-strand break repair protein AddB [Alphaproteobacteria bacterium]|nr:double-strand break repair protein AddB [Alphaproteobacteria bacterium]
MADHSPRLFTIPASVPFLPALIEALLDGRLVPGFSAANPLALADVTLYLPTRRAGRVAQNVFLDVLGTQAAILPRIVAIGDVDEDEIAFAHFASAGLAHELLALPPVIQSMERELLLAALILRWATLIAPEKGAPLVANTPAAALSLAGDLGHLIDDMTTRQVDWSRLDTLVPQEHDRYWDLTLEFLKIARTAWPGRLNELGVIDAAVHRDRLIEAETRRLRNHAAGPVVAAGSTGSMPSTARLLSTIAALPNGAVVLPGLDTDLDEASWNLIAGSDEQPGTPGHPQFALAGLLKRIGVARAAVEILAPARPHGRERFVSEALRPAHATEQWLARTGETGFSAHVADAIASVAVVEAAHPEEEALAVAVALREAVDDGTPASRQRTAALITPDRALARRVLAALARWRVPVDDSGGGPLTETPAGIFARLVAETALGGVAPASLLALLKHPLCALNRNAATLADATCALERAVLRGPRPRTGSAGLRHAVETLRRTRGMLHPRDPRTALGKADLAAAAALADDLAAALAPLETFRTKPVTLGAIAEQHRLVIENLRQGSAAGNDDGSESLARLYEELKESATAASTEIALSDYPDIFHALAAARTVRRAGDPGARVRIYGPLEARLQHAERVILAGLNEGTWPSDTNSDPWLSRPMRRELGLDLPERRIGLSAHDFAQALGAPDVLLTRSAKVAGAPAVASRFLQRLAAVGGETQWAAACRRGDRYLAWARALDRPQHVTPAPPPAPCPPREARPKRLSVTEIEHWLRDPYTIYARHILKLNRLDPVGAQPSPAERGTAIHEAIDRFGKCFRDTLPADAHGELIRIGREVFAPLDDFPEARAFWWPRFERIARWFADWENGRRADADAILTELSGALAVTGDFTLSGRIDRIEKHKDGGYAILDFKTGITPSAKQVRLGLAPQLTLEAAMLRQGGFAEVPAGCTVDELVYVQLRGGDNGGTAETLDLKQPPDAAADHALARLKTLVERFDNASQPYRSLLMPMWKNRYGTYDDLARVKEWSATGGEGSDE